MPCPVLLVVPEGPEASSGRVVSSRWAGPSRGFGNGRYPVVHGGTPDSASQLS